MTARTKSRLYHIAAFMYVLYLIVWVYRPHPDRLDHILINGALAIGAFWIGYGYEKDADREDKRL